MFYDTPVQNSNTKNNNKTTPNIAAVVYQNRDREAEKEGNVIKNGESERGKQ